MLNRLKDFFSLKPPPELHERLKEMIENSPVPFFWLFGKTQSGKTSVVRFLTGAENAEIGQGFKPTTRFSREYDFPSEKAPLLKFLDTRGLDEPGYDPEEDIAKFHDQAHVIVVVVRVLDQALDKIVTHLKKIRADAPQRPVLLVLTTTHEAYPQKQHPKPYPFHYVKAGAETFWTAENEVIVPEPLRAALQRQLERFAGLYDYAVPIDFTLAEEGFADPYYGGLVLKQALLDALPAAYRQTLMFVEGKTGELSDLFARHAMPHILTYSGIAAAAGALPVVDMVAVPAVQTRMVTQLAKLYDQPANVHRFMEVAAALGLGVSAKTVASKGLARYLPFLGARAGAAIAWAASTFALGKACCFYFSAVRQGQVPQAEDLKALYQEQVKSAEASWHAKPETA
ncbi:MAG: DUF697 domain-containing protein [Gemmataceae bacterium]